MSSLVGGSSGVALHTGVATLDFGTDPTLEGGATVSGQTDILLTSHVRCWVQGVGAITDQMLAGRAVTFTPSTITPGVGFTIRAVSDFALWSGTLQVQWEWHN